MTPETPTPPSSSCLNDPTDAQLAFTVKGRALFALTVVWEDRLGVIRASRKVAEGISGPDSAAVSALDVAEIVLEAAINETRTLMAQSIPAPTVGLS